MGICAQGPAALPCLQERLARRVKSSCAMEERRMRSLPLEDSNLLTMGNGRSLRVAPFSFKRSGNAAAKACPTQAYR